MRTPVLDAEPASERLSAGDRALVGAIFVVGGLGLVVCGGAFLMGALFLVQPQFINPSIAVGPLTVEQQSLLITLYALAGACVLGALVMFVFACRGLLRILATR